MDAADLPRRYRNFIRFHTHVTYPDESERRQQINTAEVIRRLDAIGMQHIPIPTIWDGVHLVDDGRLAGSLEIERRIGLTYRMRMGRIKRFLDDIFHWSQRDTAIYHALASALREIEFDQLEGRTDIDRAIANVALISTVKQALAIGLASDVIAAQVNWALVEVGGLTADEIELLECLPDEDSLQSTDQLDLERMALDRGISQIQLVENLETRDKIASLLSDCFGGVRRETEHKEIHPLSVRRLDIASRMLSEPGLEALVRIARIANEYVGFQPRFEKKMLPAADGDQTRMRMMQSFDELSRMVPAAWALKVASPKYFRYRVATKSFMVREKIKKSDKKQLFYAMLDRSKSMQQGERIYKLIAILMNRLRAVLRREAILGFSFFDSVVHEQVLVDEVSQARQAMQNLHSSFFLGDDTDINLAIREGITRIEAVVADTQAERPELIIVTDGDHGINVKPEELNGIILHAFIVEEVNDDLIELAKATGGVALQQL
ncbi:hypothetical protein [Rosistilla oblonga]|uniref:hypothetical protein n=1 Tax=Rosistilla oblonga TaxID=2527990 RepID=UPI003A96B410